jgi:hypothetical protein
MWRHIRVHSYSIEGLNKIMVLLESREKIEGAREQSAEKNIWT